MVRALARKAKGLGPIPGTGYNFSLSVLQPTNRRPCSENQIFNITSLSGCNTKYPFSNSHSRVCEFMTPYGIMTEVGPEVRKGGYKRLILSWVNTCPG